MQTLSQLLAQRPAAQHALVHALMIHDQLSCSCASTALFPQVSVGGQNEGLSFDDDF